MPPLRERLEDLPGLVAAFLVEIEGGTKRSIDDVVLQRLAELPWPGNVRELHNVVQRLAFEETGRITLRSLEAVLGMPRVPGTFPPAVLVGDTLSSLKHKLERDFILCHFRRLGCDTAALCRFLGLSSRQLYRRCVRLGVHLREERRRSRRGPA
jgi:DNA-binding NtrC family response regulator